MKLTAGQRRANVLSKLIRFDRAHKVVTLTKDAAWARVNQRIYNLPQYHLVGWTPFRTVVENGLRSNGVAFLRDLRTEGFDKVMNPSIIRHVLEGLHRD